MQTIRDALIQLTQGSPKQATAIIQMLMNSDQHFFRNLTNLITGEKTEQLQGRSLNGGLATLNTLALRYKLNASIKQFLTIQQIYCCLQTVLCCDEVELQLKKILLPSLTEYLASSYSTHKEILQLLNILIGRQWKTANENQSLQFKQQVFILMDSINQSKKVQKPIQIQCIVCMFNYAMKVLTNYVNVLSQCHNAQYIQIQRFEQTSNESSSHKFMPTKTYLNRIKYFISVLHGIFLNLFKTISQPYQIQALASLINDNMFADAIVEVIGWKNIQSNQNYSYIWVNDLKQFNSETILYQLCDINSIKEKCFLILAHVVSKTDPNCNLQQTSHRMISYFMTLCLSVLDQLILVCPQFQQLEKDCLISPLCDSMILFLSQCLNIKDLVPLVGQVVNLQQIIILIFKFMSIRDTDINTFQTDDQEYFAAFMEGFAGQFNLQEVNRYAVTNLVRICCKIYDSFCTEFFQACFNNILQGLNKRLLIIETENGSQNFYQHLYQRSRVINGVERNIHNVEISCCLLGFISLQDKLMRNDFKSRLIQLFIVLDFDHFQPIQVGMLIHLLNTNMIQLFQDQNISPAVSRITRNIINSAINKSGCSILAYQFVKLFLTQFLVSLDVTSKLLIPYLQIVQNIIWNKIISNFQSQKEKVSLQFYACLIQVVNLKKIYQQKSASKKLSNKSQQAQRQQINSLFHKEQRIKKCKMFIKTGFDCMVTKCSIFIAAVLKRACCQQMEMAQKQHDNIKDKHSAQVFLQLHLLIVQCLQSLAYINQLQIQGNELTRIQFRQYTEYPLNMIRTLIRLVQNSEGSLQLSIEQFMNMIQVLSIIIAQQKVYYPFQKSSNSAISSNILQQILPILLAHPFGQPWLICICQFTHRIGAKFKLNEIQQIFQLIKQSYNRSQLDKPMSHNPNFHQLKLNQLNLFIAVMLNQEQPQNWLRIHEIVRVHFVKLLKIGRLDSSTVEETGIVNSRIERQVQKNKRSNKLLQLGYQSQSVFGITVIRMFHVYLFGFKLQPLNQLLAQMLVYYQQYVQRYGVVEASHLIISLKSSYRSLSPQNFDKLISILVLILSKLLLNSNYFGNESLQQSRIRKLSLKISCIAYDPYTEFRSFIQQLVNQGTNLMHHSQYGKQIQNIMNVNIFGGQPRKLFAIKKSKD